MRLKEARTENGWSRKDLAKRAGVSQQTIMMVENGKTTPKPETLQKLANAMRIDVREITRGREILPGIYGELPEGVLGMLTLQEKMKR